MVLESILPLLERTHIASSAVRRLSNTQKKAVLVRLADVLLENKAGIMAANQKDLIRMEDTNPMKDRLLLNEKRIENLAAATHEVSDLPDPTGQVLMEKTMPNGIKLSKIAVPLGVVGIIYESRPNVTVDVVALCIRSGNAAVLRGGSDAWYSNAYLVSLIHQVLQ